MPPEASLSVAAALTGAAVVFAPVSSDFVDNLEALQGPISREALLAQLAAVGDYDAGGFLGPIQFGRQVSKGCVVLMQWRSGSWNRLTPDQGFRC